MRAVKSVGRLIVDDRNASPPTQIWPAMTRAPLGDFAHRDVGKIGIVEDSPPGSLAAQCPATAASGSARDSRHDQLAGWRSSR